MTWQRGRGAVGGGTPVPGERTDAVSSMKTGSRATRGQYEEGAFVLETSVGRGGWAIEQQVRCLHALLLIDCFLVWQSRVCLGVGGRQSVADVVATLTPWLNCSPAVFLFVCIFSFAFSIISLIYCCVIGGHGCKLPLLVSHWRRPHVDTPEFPFSPFNTFKWLHYVVKLDRVSPPVCFSAAECGDSTLSRWWDAHLKGLSFCFIWTVDESLVYWESGSGTCQIL